MGEVIQLLPDNIANQIAAGEVIQRPASVVKELIENSVDANAKNITLNIKNAGKTLIQIIDDGEGMSEGDARMCFERHATSKLKSADDLFKLSTKGFRGEALASIAAIAHVSMETKHKDDNIGTKVEIAGSKVEKQEPIARTTGTSISIKNLFFNVPARRNFLKSDSVETKHIIEEFVRVALAHPELGFKLVHNENIVHDIKATNLRQRIVNIHGANFNDKLVPVSEETDLVKVEGFVGKPEFARKTRGEQYFFVNHRFFKDSYLHHAVKSAFDNLLQERAFPSYFLFLTVPKNAIDVNIHPTKTEIKFEEDRAIYGILRSSIKLALGTHNIAPTMDFERETSFDVPEHNPSDPIKPPEVKVNPNYNPFKTDSKNSSGDGFTRSPSSGMQPNKSDWENFYNVEEEDETQNEELEFNNDNTSFAKKILFHKKYVMAQTKTGILTIHLRRAQERIIYDELMEKFIQTPIGSAQIMFPIEYEMKEEEKLEWENNKSSLERLGFTWEWKSVTSNKTLVLSGIPEYIDPSEVPSCIEEIIEKLAYSDIDKGELAHNLILSIAKGSSRATVQNVSEQEIEQFIDSLFGREEHTYTADGKKIIDNIALEELNKRFK